MPRESAQGGVLPSAWLVACTKRSSTAPIAASAPSPLNSPYSQLTSTGGASEARNRLPRKNSPMISADLRWRSTLSTNVRLARPQATLKRKYAATSPSPRSSGKGRWAA